MSITIRCECGVKLQVKDEYAGQEGRCPKCGATLHIPAPQRQDDDVFSQVQDVPLQSQAREVESRREERRDEDDRRDEPQGEVTDHGNEPIPSTMDFFADPPEEIGPVLSACSTLRKGQEPWAPGTRAALVLFIAAVGLLLGLLISVGAQIRSPFWAAFWPILLTSILAIIAFATTMFSHTVTFVGRDGLARIQCGGNRDTVSSAEVFPFSTAVDLRTHTVLHYTNGSYQHTAYTYTWSDINGVTRFVISGQHNSEAGNPPSQHAFHFARAGEIAWSNYLLNRAHSQLETGEPIRFNLAGGDWIKLGKDTISFKVGGVKEEWSASEVRSVTVQAGAVQIRHRDAQEGWFSSSGIVKFQYDQLANAQLFFFVLERVVGIPVNG